MLSRSSKFKNHLSPTQPGHIRKATLSVLVVGLLWSSSVGLTTLPAGAQTTSENEVPYTIYLPSVASQTVATQDEIAASETTDSGSTDPGLTDFDMADFDPTDLELSDLDLTDRELTEEELALILPAEEESLVFDEAAMAEYQAELTADPELVIDYGALYTALPEVNLATRHPDAGIWVSYLGSSLPLSEVQKPHVLGVASNAYWKDLYIGANKYDWSKLNTRLNYAINKAGKKTYVVVTAGYCPDLDFPAFLRGQIATRKTKNGNGCFPLQFWDPNYVNLYKTYIRAFAENLAAFDASDARPNVSDIVFVRAQVMAETMENLPTDYKNWEWADFNSASNGRIYKVNLTKEIVNAYEKEIVLYYQQELQRAYQKRGLTPPVAAAKGATNNNPGPNAEAFVDAGVWFDRHNNSPSPAGWRYDIVSKVRTGETRAGVESDKPWPVSLLSQYAYWEILVALHSGVEFIGMSAAPHKSAKTLQPRGPLGFAENREALLFGARYAGFQRNPAASPGAWVALRGGYPEDRFGTTIKQFRIWTNYDFLMTQHRPQDSVAMFGVDYKVADAGTNVSHVRRATKQPWKDELSLCGQQYSASECEYLEQTPDKYVSLSSGKHFYTYSSSALGKVRYCSTDAFCDSGSATTRTESMLWARRTDGNGGHPYMRFKINDQFAGTLAGKAVVRIVYLDQGTGKWQLRYDSISNPDKSALVVTKTNSGYWKEVTVTLSDVAFSNRQEGGTDIALYNMGDDDDVFHIIEVTRTNQVTDNSSDTRSDMPGDINDADLEFKTYLPLIQ